MKDDIIKQKRAVVYQKMKHYIDKFDMFKVQYVVYNDLNREGDISDGDICGSISDNKNDFEVYVGIKGNMVAVMNVTRNESFSIAMYNRERIEYILIDELHTDDVPIT